MTEAMNRARLWATQPYFDPRTREAAAAIASNENDLLSAFGSELSFGTGGLRGVVGVGTARMNRYTVGRATLGLAHSLRQRNARRGVVIAHDSRHDAQEFTAVTAGVLAENGIPVYVFDSLAPTPMLSYAVRALGLDAGVMITASHNPAVYNGYKVYGADGCQITDEAAAAITACIAAVTYTDARVMSEASARENGLWKDVPDSLRRSFAQNCLFCRPNPDASPSIHVVDTPLHGPGPTPKSTRRLGWALPCAGKPARICCWPPILPAIALAWRCARRREITGASAATRWDCFCWITCWARAGKRARCQPTP